MNDAWYAVNTELMYIFVCCYDGLASICNYVDLSSDNITLKNLENISLIEHLEFPLEFLCEYTQADGLAIDRVQISFPKKI